LSSACRAKAVVNGAAVAMARIVWQAQEKINLKIV
jgi:hypothetical protein